MNQITKDLSLDLNKAACALKQYEQIRIKLVPKLLESFVGKNAKFQALNACNKYINTFLLELTEIELNSTQRPLENFPLYVRITKDHPVVMELQRKVLEFLRKKRKFKRKKLAAKIKVACKKFIKRLGDLALRTETKLSDSSTRIKFENKPLLSFNEDRATFFINDIEFPKLSSNDKDTYRDARRKKLNFLLKSEDYEKFARLILMYETVGVTSHLWRRTANCYAYMLTELGITHEAVSNPMVRADMRQKYQGQTQYHGLIPDVDVKFGACEKSFLNREASDVTGGWHIEPKFTEDSLKAYSKKIIDILQYHADRTHLEGESPFFTVMYPNWDDEYCTGFQLLKHSEFKIEDFAIEKNSTYHQTFYGNQIQSNVEYRFFVLGSIPEKYRQNLNEFQATFRLSGFQ